MGAMSVANPSVRDGHRTHNIGRRSRLPRAVFALLGLSVSGDSGLGENGWGQGGKKPRGWAAFLLKFLTASRLGVGSWFLRHSCPAHMVGAAGAERHEYCCFAVQYLTAPKRAGASPQWSSAWPISAVDRCRAGVGSAWESRESIGVR
jgi:hypothetical protein